MKDKRWYKHWFHSHKLYRVWINMISRCNDKNSDSYINYWWRGISISDDWLNIKNFIDDMYSSYEEWLQIDRIDNNWSYCKENCRWVTRSQNMRNRRNNFKWRWKLVKDWCKEKWLNYNTVRSRIKLYWWSVEKAIEIAPRK